MIRVMCGGPLSILIVAEKAETEGISFIVNFDLIFR